MFQGSSGSTDHDASKEGQCLREAAGGRLQLELPETDATASFVVIQTWFVTPNGLLVFGLWPLNFVLCALNFVF